MTEVEEERQWQQFHKAQMLKFSVQCKNAEWSEYKIVQNQNNLQEMTK
jgi:hypothetical protein